MTNIFIHVQKKQKTHHWKKQHLSGKNEKKKWEARNKIYSLSFHPHVQFCGHQLTIYTCFLPSLVSLCHFWKPSNTFLHVSLSKFDRYIIESPSYLIICSNILAKFWMCVSQASSIKRLKHPQAIASDNEI